jgi:hypothetical protein
MAKISFRYKYYKLSIRILNLSIRHLGTNKYLYWDNHYTKLKELCHQADYNK